MTPTITRGYHDSTKPGIQPAQSRPATTLGAHAILAAGVGLALRLLFALRFPAPAGDSEIYTQLARNWADHHIYGLWVNGQLLRTDLRLPGYPMFLAGVAYLLGRTARAIVLSQAALDLCTCFLAAGLAVALVPARASEGARRRVAIAALWLAATCPFVANYSAAVLTEALVTFLATAALLFFALSLRQDAIEVSSRPRNFFATSQGLACLGAFFTGAASVVRPEMPLLIIVAGAVFALRWWKPFGARRVMLAGGAMAVAFLLPLAPWAVRNFVTLHEAQISAPRYATLPGEYAPVGYFAWTKTWLVRYRDVYLTVWKIGEEPVEMDDLPASAFDSPQEEQRVAGLLDEYNNSPDLEISPALDQQFADLARQRTARNPLRTYIRVPFSRALTIWFTPRTELLPISGKLFPVSEKWQESPLEFLVTMGLAALGYLYVALALGGIWVAWRTAYAPTSLSIHSNAPNFWGIALLIAYMAIRTAFLTTVETPEPRYVISCYPAVLALAALLWARRQE